MKGGIWTYIFMQFIFVNAFMYCMVVFNLPYVSFGDRPLCSSQKFANQG